MREGDAIVQKGLGHYGAQSSLGKKRRGLDKATPFRISPNRFRQSCTLG